jgi:hypothetical protein
MFLQINKVRYLEKYLTAFLCSLSKQTPTMSRAFDQISKVNDTKELWKLAVKVDDFWTTIKSSKEYAEMIIRDIQVFTFQKLINNMFYILSVYL